MPTTVWRPACSTSPLAPGSDPAFIERITVDHLWHDLAEYDQALGDQYGHLGGEAAKDRIRERVYEAIARAYPYLAQECRRQAHSAPSVRRPALGPTESIGLLAKRDGGAGA